LNESEIKRKASAFEHRDSEQLMSLAVKQVKLNR
jgi:hypothetical protein